MAEQVNALNEEVAQAEALLFKYYKQDKSQANAATKTLQTLKAENDRVEAAQKLQRSTSHDLVTLQQKEQLLRSLRGNLTRLHRAGAIFEWSANAEIDYDTSLAEARRQMHVAWLAKQAAAKEFQRALESAQNFEHVLDRITDQRRSLGVSMTQLRHELERKQQLIEELMAQGRSLVAPSATLSDSVGCSAKKGAKCSYD